MRRKVAATERGTESQLLLGMIGMGIVSGFLAAVMAWQATGSILMTVLSYMLFGSLGTVLFATAAAFRRASVEADSDLTRD